jgi:hypothetical protein
LALSDAHHDHAPARFFELAVDLRARPLGVVARAVHRIGGPFASGDEDPEGIAFFDRALLIASEGDGGRLRASLHRVALDGTHIAPVTLPPNIAARARENKAFEGLSAAPSGHRAVLTTEHALVGDGPVPSFDEGTRVRIVVFDERLRATAQHAYLTDAVPRDPRPGTVTRADIGVSALTMLDDDEVLVMERAGVAVDGVFDNRIRIYQIHLRAAVDVSHIDSLGPDAPFLAKRLVLDLDEVRARLTTPALDNFEAMALGPPLGAQRSLLIASDDNFSPSQRSVLLAFTLAP